MSEEIKNKIEALNAQLEKEMDPTTFVLNPTSVAIFREIEVLQKQCKHSFENGECQYCGWRESNG